MSGNYAESPFELSQFKLLLQTLQPTQNTQTDNSFPFELQANHLRWQGLQFERLKGSGLLQNDAFETTTSGSLSDSDLQLEVTYGFDWRRKKQSGRIHLENKLPGERSTLSLHEVFPDLATTIVSAIFTATMHIADDGETLRLPLTGNILEGTITLPNQGMSIKGLTVPNIEFEDVITGVTRNSLILTIDEIDYPPTVISHLRCEVSITDGYTLHIDCLRFEFCGGKFEITFQEPIAAPYDTFDCHIAFETVDIQKLTRLIPDFKEDLTGTLDGHLPFRFDAGNISWGRGIAQLTPGTTARLKYAENGLFASYIPEIEISQDLDININEALRDITLTELSLNIQPSAQFDLPSVVLMSGHSNNSKIEIPIERIQLNIRAADVPGLLNKTFKSKDWVDSILFSQ